MTAGVVGALAVGAYLGSQFGDFGLGEGAGGPPTLAGPGVGGGAAAVTPPEPADEPLDDAPEQPAEPAVDVPSGPPEMLVVRIGDGRYMTHAGDGFLAEKTLAEVVAEVTTTTGTEDGLRVRIERTPTARAIDQSRLQEALREAGLRPEEVQLTGDFVDGQ